MVDPARHADSRNALESLLRKIPGFKGYLEREYRRESDELARALVADLLKKCRKSLDVTQRSLVDAGQIDALPNCERIRSRLDLLQSRVQGAMRGYSGFFDFVTIDEDVLEQVYQHDLSLADEVQRLVAAIEKLPPASGASFGESLSAIADQINQLEVQVDRRSKFLEGLTR